MTMNYDSTFVMTTKLQFESPKRDFQLRERSKWRSSIAQNSWMEINYYIMS